MLASTLNTSKQQSDKHHVKKHDNA